MSVHIVWDWNGTLLDDLELVVRAVSRSVERLGHPPISPDDYRDHYTRPVRQFYDSLFGRHVGDMEWLDLNKTFHELYYAEVDAAALAADAVDALQRAADLGWGQSLLSMSTHEHLVPTVEAHGIAHYFDLITGLIEPSGDMKASHLRAHLASQHIDGKAVVVVGDTPDDHDAARSVGARAILYDGGSHHRSVLDAVGAPVVATLHEALDLIEAEVSV
ncbi:MAG: HAD family hydrolase [Actinobacteria bacterium]|nr:MAG: HAD family hydrolase [Actinomycetota bacterium]